MAIKSRKLKKGPSLADADRVYAAAKEQVESTLREAVERVGLNERVAALRSKIDEMDVRRSVDEAQQYLSDQIDAARGYAKENPGKVIGGAAGVLVGASLLAYALSRKPASTKKKKAAAKKKKSTTTKKRR